MIDEKLAQGVLGQGRSRVDGRAKVTGEAKYAGEFVGPELLHGVVVSSTIACGKILTLDTTQALELPGVAAVFTHDNRPGLAWFDRSYRDDDAPAGSPLRPLRDEEIVYSGQPIALVVAATLELARYAATLVKVTYQRAPHETELAAHLGRARKPKSGKLGYEAPPKPRGKAEAELAKAAARVDGVYVAPTEFHNPMELQASTVIYEPDGKLTIHDKTQGVLNSQSYVCKVFGLSKDDVRVLAPFVGGAFGSGLRPQYQLFLAVMAARELKRSVRVVLTRQQMFTFGHRPSTVQRVALGASADGTLQAMIHEATSATSRFEDYAENVVTWSGQLYPSETTSFDHKVVPLDEGTPLDMRAPGATWGVFAIESAMDELSYELGINPLELRLRNYSDKDNNTGKPFSSKALLDCYEQGGVRFGWRNRTPAPRSMRDGKSLVGWGHATAVWESSQMPARARASLGSDGRLVVASATEDIGTGTYTVMSQIAAETLGLPLEAVTFQLGDSSFPMAPLQGGSFTVASVGSAVKAACEKVASRLYSLATRVADSPLEGVSEEEVVFVGGFVRKKGEPARAVSFHEAMRQGSVDKIEEDVTTLPLPAQALHARATHAAVFVEVKVDEDLGTLEVTRVVSAVAAGRILNPKTARSRILGAVVWGIGSALHEEALINHNLGRVMNHSLAEYHVPVNADVHDIDVIFVEEHDSVVNPLGAKGVGEIGIVGVAAAIANAIYHATGTRVRSLPITLDKVFPGR